ncbi:MAG: MBOAT family protein [Polyangiales bacterium]
MAFNSIAYAIFFGVVFLLFWALRRAHTARTLLLVAASVFFYTRFNYGPSHRHLGWVYLAVLFSSATIDFFLAKAMFVEGFKLESTFGGETLGSAPSRSFFGRLTPHQRRKALLILSVVYNLSVLAWFKYTGFAVENVHHLLALLHISASTSAIKIVLPIGISFFTFETMSYTIDVYRGELAPSKSFLEYLLFISFFPHLVAGPIIRPKVMLPQLRSKPVLDATLGSKGLFLIGAGLLKKMVVADYLALNHVDRVFDRPEWFSAPEALAAIYGYALQIYCDFSGYTDIAIGSALLLGYVLPKNFDAPYTATSLQDFWRRWHISLSSWLRDYLYIPLGGSKGTPLKTYRNLMITMLLGGLWHGASWNFVLWGAMHGLALAGTRMWQRRGATRLASSQAHRTLGESRLGKEAHRPSTEVASEPSFRPKNGLFAHHPPTLGDFGKGFLTFHYVCLSWVFFRADGFGRATALLKQVIVGRWQATNLSSGVMLVLAAGFISHLMPEAIYRRIRDGFVDLPAPLQGGVVFLVAVLLREAATNQVVPFVYYQF